MTGTRVALGTATPLVEPAIVDPAIAEAATAAANAVCPACPHPLVDHDRISSRYCSATVTNTLHRGCICQ